MLLIPNGFSQSCRHKVLATVLVRPTPRRLVNVHVQVPKSTNNETTIVSTKATRLVQQTRTYTSTTDTPITSRRNTIRISTRTMSLPLHSQSVPLVVRSKNTRRMFSSSRSKDRVQIPEHVAVFSLFLLPVIAFYLYYEKTNATNQQQLEETLRRDYHSEITHATSKKGQIAQVLQLALENDNPNKNSATKSNTTDQVQQQLQEVLYAGKDRRKRLHAIQKNNSQAGETPTNEPVKVVAATTKKQPKKKKMKGNKAANTPSTETKDRNSSVPLGSPTHLVAVAAVAAVVGFVLGGNRKG